MIVVNTGNVSSILYRYYNILPFGFSIIFDIFSKFQRFIQINVF